MLKATREKCDLGKLADATQQLKDALTCRSDIDEEIADYLATINSYKGVWTQSSCAGHTVEEVVAHANEGKKLGRTLYPWLTLYFDNPNVFHAFCREIAPVGDKTAPVLVLYANANTIEVEPPTQDSCVSLYGRERIYAVPPERLPYVRQALFERVIAALDNVVIRRLSPEEIKFKLEYVISAGEDEKRLSSE